MDMSCYSVIWAEADTGRGANEIASGLIAVLYSIKETHPDVNKITLWSDLSVSLNCNSAMTLALKLFMNTREVEEIVQRFCCPGHSEIQEVDNVHSGIEKVLKCEVYSPVSLIRAMKTVRRKADFNII
ncbi:hypothetical protein DPMN_077365 [Dreissena polymorpha]|uniref:Uncharacterized protein n=1 Tax=Dreissena polymorpha TaxID=45954 RepID=A0A9D3YP42_DREPO|nr:hypothetical protein DPMN_077365 [Dreissena polymorpha]